MKSTQHEMMLMTEHSPDNSSYIVCIQNLPIGCSQEDVIDLLNSMFAVYFDWVFVHSP